MKRVVTPVALSFATLALAACVSTGTGSGSSGNATSAERACARAVAESLGVANVNVIEHVPYSRGAITNVEVPSRNARFICHTDGRGAVFELLEV
jgi:hypothetical protein